MLVVLPPRLTTYIFAKICFVKTLYIYIDKTFVSLHTNGQSCAPGSICTGMPANISACTHLQLSIVESSGGLTPGHLGRPLGLLYRKLCKLWTCIRNLEVKYGYKVHNNWARPD